MKQYRGIYKVTYSVWMLSFVVLPFILLIIQSLLTTDGQWTLANYIHVFEAKEYWQLLGYSLFYAAIITLLTLGLGYPMALLLTQCKHKQLWMMLVILPTWINVLLKAYAFMGLLATHGGLNQWLAYVHIGPIQWLFTATGFVITAVYIELPFMMIPIFNAIDDIPLALIQASQDLGANKWQTFWHVIWPLSLSGVKSGVQTVFIPSLSLFMLTRLIAGNRVMTLGTAIESQFLVTQNWGMGATIGVILIVLMMVTMWIVKEGRQ